MAPAVHARVKALDFEADPISSTLQAIPSADPPLHLLIDGRLTAGATTLDVTNPATGTRFVTCAPADLAQLQQAVAAAKRAVTEWSGATLETRRAALFTLADALEARTAEFARLLTQEQGKPIAKPTKRWAVRSPFFAFFPR